MESVNSFRTRCCSNMCCPNVLKYRKFYFFMMTRRMRPLALDVKTFCFVIVRNLVSASQDGKLIVWDGYTTNKVTATEITHCFT